MWGGLGKVMRDYAFWQSHGRRRAFQMNLSKLRHFRGTYTVSVCVSLDGCLMATLSSSRHKSQLRREILSMNVLLPSMLRLWLIGLPKRGDARCQCKILTSVHTCVQLNAEKMDMYTRSPPRLCRELKVNLVVTLCGEGLVRENRRKMQEGGARAERGWRDGRRWLNCSPKRPTGEREEKERWGSSKEEGCYCSSQFFSLGNKQKKKKQSKTGASNKTSGKQQMSIKTEWGMISVLEGDHHTTPSDWPLWGKQWHNGLVSGMQRISRYSYGCWVIGPCLHIKHRSLPTWGSALDVLGWNSMQDGVRNTHCTALSQKKKKKKGLVHANRHNRSYIRMHKLFTGSFETVYSDTRRLPSPRLSRTPRFNTRRKREATGWTGGGKGKQAGFIWRKIRQVLTACRLNVIADQAAIWFCDQFSNEPNNSSQPEDGFGATITGSRDKLTTFPWCPEAAFPLYHKTWPTVQIINERGSDSRATNRHSRVYVHMHACMQWHQRCRAADCGVGWQT